VSALSLSGLYNYHSTTGLTPNLSLEERALWEIRSAARLSSRGISISYTTASMPFRFHRPGRSHWISDDRKSYDFEVRRRTETDFTASSPLLPFVDHAFIARYATRS
jgi:hypothetical protein